MRRLPFVTDSVSRLTDPAVKRLDDPRSVHDGLVMAWSCCPLKARSAASCESGGPMNACTCDEPCNQHTSCYIKKHGHSYLCQNRACLQSHMCLEISLRQAAIAHDHMGSLAVSQASRAILWGAA